MSEQYLLQLIKQAAIEAVAAGKPMQVVFGTVVSANPLKIKVESGLILDEDFFVKTATAGGKLKKNDRVVLLRMQGGQQYLILDRISGGEAEDPQDYDTAINDLKEKYKKLLEQINGINAKTDKHYTHTQSSAAAEWTVTHNLGKHPAVSVVDSAGTEVVGDVEYIDINTCKLIFSAAFSGKAYFN